MTNLIQNCDNCCHAETCKYKEEFELICSQVKNAIPTNSIFQGYAVCTQWLPKTTTFR